MGLIAPCWPGRIIAGLTTDSFFHASEKKKIILKFKKNRKTKQNWGAESSWPQSPSRSTDDLVIAQKRPLFPLPPTLPPFLAHTSSRGGVGEDFGTFQHLLRSSTALLVYTGGRGREKEGGGGRRREVRKDRGRRWGVEGRGGGRREEDGKREEVGGGRSVCC